MILANVIVLGHMINLVSYQSRIAHTFGKLIPGNINVLQYASAREECQLGSAKLQFSQTYLRRW